MGAKTGCSRDAIRRSALVVFCQRGYRTTTLAEIGARVGVTRGTVLHHFHSKADLLKAVTEPYRVAVVELMDSVTVDDPPTVAQQRQLISELLELLLDHRSTFQLLSTDVAARVELGLVSEWAAPSAQIVSLLLGAGAGDIGQIRVAAALGALVQPVTFVGLDLHTANIRHELIDSAVAVLAGPELARTDVFTGVALDCGTRSTIPVAAK